MFYVHDPKSDGERKYKKKNLEVELNIHGESYWASENRLGKKDNHFNCVRRSTVNVRNGLSFTAAGENWVRRDMRNTNRVQLLGKRYG